MTESTVLLLDGASGIGAKPHPVSFGGCKCRYSCPIDSEAPLQPLAFLRLVLFSASQFKIIWQASQQIESMNHGAILLPQHNLIASTKDLYFLTLQAKLFRQPDRLAIARSKHTRGRHPAPLNDVYTHSIHINCISVSTYVCYSQAGSRAESVGVLIRLLTEVLLVRI